ncbi:hypothetical protein [Sciscionella marina]|uniref:hypothetical protein n=1 Tax=Sciscionella marina TaxID=508770 RepID=UPI00039FCCCA|nr:hypothetical protein [Sciscionella marina]
MEELAKVRIGRDQPSTSIRWIAATATLFGRIVGVPGVGAFTPVLRALANETVLVET